MTSSAINFLMRLEAVLHDPMDCGHEPCCYLSVWANTVVMWCPACAVTKKLPYAWFLPMSSNYEIWLSENKEID